VASERDGEPVVLFADQEELTGWLAEHGETATGVWCQLAKKDATVATVSYPEAVEAALRHGWIDAKSAALNDEFWLQRLTRRTARSRWSRANRDAAERMIAAGTMTPAGLRQVEAAQADGRWAAAYEAETVPDDLQSELDENPAAAATFAALSMSVRVGIHHHLREAKRPETRARRLAKLIGKLADGAKQYP
jgi:uncharacterized protein YdeI (YjbR/CyaY-like superfamily)